jgi:hypothetical protein
VLDALPSQFGERFGGSGTDLVGDANDRHEVVSVSGDDGGAAE